MDSRVCFCCKSATDIAKLVSCSICKNAFRYACVGLTLGEIKSISSKTGLSWTCDSCSVIGSDINDLKAALVDLKNEVAQLKTSNVPEISNKTIETIIQEVYERHKRRKNIIFYGITENQGGRYANEDNNKVKSVLNFLEVNSTEWDIKPMRLGRINPSTQRPRPIKLVLSSEEDVHCILRKASKLKNSEFDGVHISQDRTPREIDYYKSLKNEMAERISKGEINLRIKYQKGVPVIQSLN